MKKIVQFIFITAALLFISFTATGCWDNLDVVQRSIVVAIGFDREEDGKISVTLQTAKPAGIKAIQDQGADTDSDWVYTAKGDTVMEAVRNHMTAQARKPFLSHLQLIVIGEKLAQEGILEILDYFEREPELPLKVNVLLSKGIQAKDVLEAETNLESIPAIHISEILENERNYSKIKHITLFDLLQQLSAPGFETTIGVIGIEAEKSPKLVKDMEVAGLSVFRQDRLIGWVSPEKTRGILFILNEIQSANINLSNQLNGDKKAAVIVMGSAAEKRIDFEGNRPLFSIDVKAEGNLVEYYGEDDIALPPNRKKLEKEVAKEIEQEIRTAIVLAQKEFRSDIFGFGNLLYHQQLSYWREVEDHWEDVFCRIPIDVNVTFKIRRIGYVSKSLEIR
ncbi:MAG: Ger(x)C family spore germination protein [Thermotaleaceae bacterium]